MSSVKVRNFLAFALCLIACSCAKAEWRGIYFCELEFGSTVPGQAVIVEQALVLSADGCTLSVNGYQVSENIICKAESKGDGVAINFVSYADGSVKNIYGVQVYEAGETLFILTGDTARPATIWKSMWTEDIPAEGKNCFIRQD